MMIHRKICEVRTTGKRETRNLHPIIGESLPHGFNYKVLEYDEEADTAIIEIWCSDHPLLNLQDQKDEAALNNLTKHESVIKTLDSHPKSPTVLARIKIDSTKLENFDAETKTVTLKGKQADFLRTETSTVNKQQVTDLILDEG